MKASFSSTIIFLVCCTVFFSSPGKAEENTIIPTSQVVPEKKTAPSRDPILEGYKNFEQTKPQQPVINKIPSPDKAVETLKKTSSDIISKKPLTPIQSTDSNTSSLEDYKNFEQTTPQQPVINKTPSLDKAVETLKKTSSDIISKKPLTPIQSTVSDTGLKEPVDPIQPTASQLQEEESETFKNLDYVKPQPDSAEIFLLHKKLLDTIAQVKIEEATALAEELIQDNPQDSEGLLDKKTLENIHASLKGLSLVEWRLKNRRLKLAAFKLREIKKEAPVQEIRHAVETMEAQLMEIEKLDLQRVELHKDFTKGIKKLNERRWLDAISIFTKIKAKAPGYPQIDEKLKEARIGNYLDEGSRLIGAVRIEEAEKMYQSVLELDPENIIAVQQISVLSQILDKKIVSSQDRSDQVREIDSPDITENPKPKTVTHESSESQSEPIKFISSPRFRKILNYLYQYQDSLKPIAAGVGGTMLFFLLIFRLGKIRKRFGTIKRLNANRILYERILENTPNRRALYPSLASIYRQLKMEMKLPWLIESCNERLYNANSHEAPLWQLCLGEIHLEYGNLEVALREIEQAWHMDPSREEIRQKLERLYLSLLKQDPENMEWKSGLQRLSPPFTEHPSPGEGKETEEEILARERNKEISPPPRQQEKDKRQPKRTEKENKEILHEILGRTRQPEVAKAPPPSQNLAEQEERQIEKKPDIFSQERKKEAYEELFGRRKKQPQKETKVEALDKT